MAKVQKYHNNDEKLKKKDNRSLDMILDAPFNLYIFCGAILTYDASSI
jgi:hypothetical protein